MRTSRPARLILSLVLAASLVGCQTAQVSEEARARADWNLQQCLKTSDGAIDFCQGQYDSEIASAKASADTAEDSGTSGLWWKIPLVIVAVPVLLLAYAYANKGGGFADGGRYKGYKTYDSTYRSASGTTRCRTQIGGGNSFTDCY